MFCFFVSPDIGWHERCFNPNRSYIRTAHLCGLSCNCLFGIKLPLNKDVYTQTMLMARHQRIAKLFDEEFGVTRWRSLEKQECDRQMSGSGWPLSVAFWFGLIGAGCGPGTYIVNGRKVRKRWLLACSMEIRMDRDAALESFRLG